MQITAVVIGAGHAGLAMSRRLTDRSIDHVVLERGEAANSWRTRWPSLRLLTPNWQTRLPGHDYAGEDPDGYMPVADVVATLTRYARLINAPVRAATTVRTVRAAPQGFEILADDDVFHARAVVLATGAAELLQADFHWCDVDEECVGEPVYLWPAAPWVLGLCQGCAAQLVPGH